MGDDFKNKIYLLTRLIPKGKVATYGQLARLAEKPKAARAVGVFMKNNPDAPVVPCHRIAACDGKLTGYSGTGGIAQKKCFLMKESHSKIIKLTFLLQDGKSRFVSKCIVNQLTGHY